MIKLASNKISGYDLDVPAQSGAGRDNPIGIGSLALLKALFVRCPSMVGDVGQP